MQNKYTKMMCYDCGKDIGYRSFAAVGRCRKCRNALLKLDPSKNPMYGKQNCSKFRPTYPNVKYDDFILYIEKSGKNTRRYRMNCHKCGNDRGYLTHKEAKRSCYQCDVIKKTRKNKQQKRIYASMKANISVRFRGREINKEYGIFRHLPYSLDDLMRHLEKQFEPWMSWSNYGPYLKNKKTWQIDHITPDSSFKYSNFSDEDFIKSWALSNLRPLESLKNILKSNKL